MRTLYNVAAVVAILALVNSTPSSASELPNKDLDTEVRFIYRVFVDPEDRDCHREWKRDIEEEWNELMRII